ncbi:hypothetical protein MTO96_031050 [Rhipicephalus appendiculatus]
MCIVSQLTTVQTQKAVRLLSETDDEPDASSADEEDDSGYPDFEYCGFLLDDSEDTECLGLDAADFKLGDETDETAHDETASCTDSMWAKVEMFIQSLQPAQEATKVLQTEQLTIGDFYGAWLTCSMKTSAIPSPLAKALVESMKKRERNLCSRNIFWAALYIDYSYCLLLTPDQKYQASMHLCKTWEQITGLRQKQCSSFIVKNTAAPTSEETGRYH